MKLLLPKSSIINLQKSVKSEVGTNHQDEVDAIASYKKLLAQVKDEKVRAIIEEIMTDEKNHKYNLEAVKRYLAGDTSALDEDKLEKAVKPTKGNKSGAKLEEKYPGGKWVTMHGHHVYIMKNGKPAPETPMPEGAVKEAAKSPTPAPKT